MSADIAAEGMESLASFLALVKDTIEAQTDLRMSKAVIDHATTTKRPLLDKTFSIDYQTRNTGLYRETDMLRLAEDLTVHMVFQIRPSEQFVTLKAASRAEESVMRALQEQIALGGTRCVYTGTRRTKSANLEYLLVDLVHEVEHDWYSQPLSPST